MTIKTHPRRTADQESQAPAAHGLAGAWTSFLETLNRLLAARTAMTDQTDDALALAAAVRLGELRCEMTERIEELRALGVAVPHAGVRRAA